MSGGVKPPVLIKVELTVGSHYSQKGGGANYQCITEEPTNLDFGPSAGTAERAHMYGAEYRLWGSVPSASLPFFTCENGAFFFHVEPRCGLLPCPPYDPQKEMACALCTC